MTHESGISMHAISSLKSVFRPAGYFTAELIDAVSEVSLACPLPTCDVFSQRALRVASSGNARRSRLPFAVEPIPDVIRGDLRSLRFGAKLSRQHESGRDSFHQNSV